MEEGGELTSAATPQPRTSPRSAAAAAEEEAAAAPPSLADVPDNIPVRISAFLPCLADRAHMACVNRLWSRAVRGVGRPPPPTLPPLPPPPPQLPWLIFPNTEAPTFYSPITRRHHRLFNLPPDVRRARLCGSGDGGWLVLALDSRHGYALYNLGSGERFPLPPGYMTARNAPFPLVVRAATLSAAPSRGTDYMVAAIVNAGSGGTNAAFWCEGNGTWFSPPGMRAFRPQDVIFYQGSFFFLGADERVVAFGQMPGPDGTVAFGRGDYDMEQREGYAEDVGYGGRMRRYLVESRGGLLMVIRYIHDGTTLTIRVFELVPTEEELVDGALPRVTWEHIGTVLEGRMLFLGRGCSRCFEVADYNGFQESMIYFLDDGMVAVPSADDRTLYSFTDMGRYDMDEIEAAPWPEGLYQRTSDNAPPTWWLH
ncbi:hypothetical protein HU200_038797 [Digitaria exilis]|uniref:KIB1-4 beta-propeller domain-containing protein n=1 Tax=Digitaria exilis TaxID=1010633 RepID=A0A835B977_9POAL|nr:hypothetical protein HU200_038797 [Digitaria exilis]CAB3450022.1 unnamed protein product [Digitaria exilis]